MPPNNDDSSLRQIKAGDKMAETEFKRYDTNHSLEVRNIRLAKDAAPVGSTHKVTFVLTSKNERSEDMWIDAIPGEGDELAKYLKKGDVLSATGFLESSRWGDNNDKIQYTLRFARLHYPFELLKVLQERASIAKPQATSARTRRAGATVPNSAPDLTDDIPF